MLTDLQVYSKSFVGVVFVVAGHHLQFGTPAPPPSKERPAIRPRLRLESRCAGGARQVPSDPQGAEARGADLQDLRDCGAFMLFVHLDLGGTKAARQSHIWGWNEDERVGDCCGTTETELGDESDEHASIDEPPLFPLDPM